MTRDRGGVVSHEKVDLLQLAATAAAAIIQKRRRMLGEGGRERRKSRIHQSFSVCRGFGRALIPAADYAMKTNTFPRQRYKSRHMCRRDRKMRFFLIRIGRPEPKLPQSGDFYRGP